MRSSYLTLGLGFHFGKHNNNLFTFRLHAKAPITTPATDIIADDSFLGKYLPTSMEPSEYDIRCIADRQVFGETSGIFAVDQAKCKYGHPQAFVRVPVGTRISSGMLRLSCPLLVKLIDEYEASGGIEYINKLVANNSSLQENFKETNRIWREIKLNSVSHDQIEIVKSAFGEEGAEHIFGSGIIGVTQDKIDDVKCLHAHTADYLLRGTNLIGKLTLEILGSQGAEVRGCEGCSDQCGGIVQKDEARWWYVSVKNKLKLQGRRVRRLAFKEKMRTQTFNCSDAADAVP